MLAYGQTGSGKTYTMTGLMNRSFRELFARINHKSDVEFAVSCSYCELYNEQIFDLLDPKKERKNLSLRQDAIRGVFVEKLKEETLFSVEQLLECLSLGTKYRHWVQT